MKKGGPLIRIPTSRLAGFNRGGSVKLAIPERHSPERGGKLPWLSTEAGGTALVISVGLSHDRRVKIRVRKIT
ncbi:MAG: hypothetical protein AAB511_03910 [Patescibacteria group bacterium]|mgnify:FL=1